MPLTKEQWAAAKNALPILGQMLKDKNAVLAETEGNLWRLGEKLANTPNVPVDPQKIAALLYSIVLADVNGVINGVPGSGQLFWSQKPPKLLAFEKSRGVGKLATHLPEKQERRVSSESASERAENLIQLERIYDGLPYVSPRTATLRTYINNVKEDSSISSAEALKVCKKFLATQDVRVALRDLQALLANNITLIEYLDSKRQAAPTKSSVVRDISEFLL